jgi:hypothetical protein
VRHHYQPQQCSAPANPFTSRPLHSNPDPCIAPAAPLSSSPGQRYGYQRHTLPRLTSPVPCCTVAPLFQFRPLPCKPAHINAFQRRRPAVRV